MRTVVLVVFYVALVILALPYIFGCMAVGAHQAVVDFGRWGLRVGRTVLGLEIEIRGAENVPSTPAPLVFMGNHESFLDGPLMIMILPRFVRVIAKKSIFRIPVIGPAMRFVGFIAVDRKGLQEGKRSIIKAARKVRERRYSFLLFPEGTRTRDGRMQPFRRGGFYLAIDGGADIVPFTIRGAYELMPRGQPYVRRGRITVAYHPPVPVAGYTIETMPALMSRVRAAIMSGMDDSKKGPEPAPA